MCGGCCGGGLSRSSFSMTSSVKSTSADDDAEILAYGRFRGVFEACSTGDRFNEALAAFWMFLPVGDWT